MLRLYKIERENAILCGKKSRFRQPNVGFSSKRRPDVRIL